MSASEYRPNLWVFYGVFFLAFLQLLSDFVESIYVFGLLRVSLTPEVAAVLLLFSPLVLLGWRKRMSPASLLVLGAGVLIARLIAVWAGPSGRLLASGLGVGCWLVAFPGWLWRIADAPQSEDSLSDHAVAMGMGLALALCMSVLLRTSGDGFDLSMNGGHRVSGSALFVIAGWAMLRLFRGRRSLPDVSQGVRIVSAEADIPRFSFGRIALMSLGLFCALGFGYFVLMSPNVVARWTGVDYPLILLPLMAALGVFSGVLSLRPHWLARLTRGGLLLWNLLFLLALLLTIGAHHIAFPASVDAYPLVAPPVTGYHHIPLFLMLLMSPVALVDFIFCTRELLSLRPRLAQLGGAFALATFALLCLMLAQIFTTVYAYIPVVGPWFRDRFWLVFLGVGLGCMAPLWGTRRFSFSHVAGPRSSFVGFGIGMALLGIISVVYGWASVPHPPAPPENADTLRVLTYNVQQGYDPNGVKSFAGQLALLRAADADIIGLQETDTSRIAGGNADLVGYFARGLNMHAYYGPKTVPGTFGIALLSRYPLQNPQTFYMYSPGEQTATIVAQVRVGERDFNIYVTHLDNDGLLVQQAAVLTHARGREAIILMGDFNATEEFASYRMTVETLEDAWRIQEAQPSESPGFDFATCIDHIFVSPGIQVSQTRYLDNALSDHPLMWADLVVRNQVSSQ